MPDAPSNADAGDTPSPEPDPAHAGRGRDGEPAANAWKPFSPGDQDGADTATGAELDAGPEASDEPAELQLDLDGSAGEPLSDESDDADSDADVAAADPETQADTLDADAESEGETADVAAQSQPDTTDARTELQGDPDPEPAQAVLVGTAAHVASLVDEILDPERTQPVIVVTAKPSAGAPFVDADALAASVGEKASVWVLDDADLTWSLTDALPPKLDVYGGAVRAYNPLDEGDTEPYPSDHPQWTVFNADEGDKVVRLVTTYIDLVTQTRLPAFGETTTATVTTVRKAGAELELATGHPGFVSIGHLIQHGEVFHAGDVLQEGQEVPVRVGAWNPHAGRLSVTMREFAPDPWERLAEVYEPGMLIEGGVSGVTDFGAFIELLPGVEGLLHKSKIADEFVEYVDDYVREGDRITVRLLDLDPQRQKAGVSLRDVPRGATAEPPASIFPGGPPWLPMPTAEPATDESSEAPAGEATDDDGGARAGAAADDTEASALLDDAATTAATFVAAHAAADAAAGAVPTAGPAYLAELDVLRALIAEHGADATSPLAELVRDALERGITTFDARLDEDDEGSEDEDDPLVQLRNAAADLIDALRVEDDDDDAADGDDGHDDDAEGADLQDDATDGDDLQDDAAEGDDLQDDAAPTADARADR